VTPQELAIITTSAVSVIGLATWWFWLQSAYACDSFRQKVFALRDEMFDYAAEGAIPFESPAYAELRLLMNRVLRFAHRITFWKTVGYLVIESVSEDREQAISFRNEWITSVNSVADASVRAKLYEFEERLGVLIIDHVFKTSLAAVTFAFAVVLVISVLQLKQSAVQFLARIIRPGEIEERAWNHSG
jgi:hypothetical protein